MAQNNNIISIEGKSDDTKKLIQDKIKDKVADNVTKSIQDKVYIPDIVKTHKYIIIITLIIIIFIILYLSGIFNTTSNTKVKNNKNNKNNKNTDSDTDSDTESDSEGYKTQQVRADPYDEYDLDSEIKNLLSKQEKYLEKINTYISYE